MAPTKDEVLNALKRIQLPDGGDPVSRDMVRALAVEGGRVRFILEADSADAANRLAPVRDAAEAIVRDLPGVGDTQIALSAPSPSPAGGASARGGPGGGAAAQQGGEAPSLSIGRHPRRQSGPQPIAGVDRILAIASGKGGVGKSSVAVNTAVALARAGRRVGLLDADIHGPSVPRMMGTSKKPASEDGQTILPLHAHGVTFMSIGLLLGEGESVVWRGPMLMGALQQMLTQVKWGELDVLIVDLPPGTGDVQLSLCQNVPVTGALIVSTPQDVALLDARKAIDMFGKLKAPIAGLIENMSVYVCPNCGHESHLFGQGGVRAEAERIGAPLLAEIPLTLGLRESGDAGLPAALGDDPAAAAFAALAARLIEADRA